LKDEELKQLVSKKMFLIDCFLVTGTLKTENNPDLILKHGVTNYFLGSVILELLIKILYELDYKKQAPFTHNILKIFEELKQQTKSIVQEKYDQARKRKEEVFKKIDKSVTFPPLHEVLTSNEQFIKDFKYNAMASKTNSAIDGVFYNEIIGLINSEVKKLNSA